MDLEVLQKETKVCGLSLSVVSDVPHVASDSPGMLRVSRGVELLARYRLPFYQLLVSEHRDVVPGALCQLTVEQHVASLGRFWSHTQEIS